MAQRAVLCIWRLVQRNPFARVGVARGPGRRYEQPPTEQQVWRLIDCARELATPSFAGWLQVSAFTGMRPGELDALRRANVDPARRRIRVVDQFSAATGKVLIITATNSARANSNRVSLTFTIVE